MEISRFIKCVMDGPRMDGPRTECQIQMRGKYSVCIILSLPFILYIKVVVSQDRVVLSSNVMPFCGKKFCGRVEKLSKNSGIARKMTGNMESSKNSTMPTALLAFCWQSEIAIISQATSNLDFCSENPCWISHNIDL